LPDLATKDCNDLWQGLISADATYQ